MDIVLPEEGKQTGFLAQIVDEFADAILKILQMSESEKHEMTLLRLKYLLNTLRQAICNYLFKIFVITVMLRRYLFNILICRSVMCYRLLIQPLHQRHMLQRTKQLLNNIQHQSYQSTP